jgi:hypothetical protein
MKSKIYDWNHFVDFLVENESGGYKMFNHPNGLVKILLDFLQWCKNEAVNTTINTEKKMIKEGKNHKWKK